LGFNSPLLITGSPPAIHTVKPVYNGHLGENDKMTTIYRWPLYEGVWLIDEILWAICTLVVNKNVLLVILFLSVL
jgi:hypothetical protein